MKRLLIKMHFPRGNIQNKTIQALASCPIVSPSLPPTRLLLAIPGAIGGLTQAPVSSRGKLFLGRSNSQEKPMERKKQKEQGKR